MFRVYARAKLMRADSYPIDCFLIGTPGCQQCRRERGGGGELRFRFSNLPVIENRLPIRSNFEIASFPDRSSYSRSILKKRQLLGSIGFPCRIIKQLIKSLIKIYIFSDIYIFRRIFLVFTKQSDVFIYLKKIDSKLIVLLNY